MTRDEAVELIERMKTTRPTCDKCPRIDEVNASFLAAGWEDLPHKAGMVARCPSCASGKLFPWADKITPEAVAAFIEKEPWRDDTAWPLDDLRAVADAMTAPGGFEFL